MKNLHILHNRQHSYQDLHTLQGSQVQLSVSYIVNGVIVFMTTKVCIYYVHLL